MELKMAGMKSWLEKIKNRILKKDLDDDLLKSKIQSVEESPQEVVEKKELPDLITPTNEEINEVQREEAIRVKEMHERKMNRESVKSTITKTSKTKIDNIKSSIETRPWWTRRSNSNRWKARMQGRVQKRK